MSELFFVLKTVLFSALVLMALQFKVAGSTLEQHSQRWIYHSRIGGEMQTIARGAVRAGYEGWDWLQVQISENTKKNTQERTASARSRSDDLE